mgnify:CR=1 FL=1
MAVHDSGSQCRGGESREHNTVGGTDACASQHSEGKFRHHGHVDGDVVALADTLSLQDIGDAARVAEYVFVRERFAWSGKWFCSRQSGQ